MDGCDRLRSPYARSRKASVCRRHLRFAAVALAASTVITAVVTTSGVAASAASRLPVTAFQSESDATALIDRDRSAVTTVGVDGVLIATGGARVQLPSTSARAQLVRSHRDHLRAELLVSNFSDALGDFSEPTAYRLLSDRDHRAAVANALTRDVTGRGWDGISVDLEAMTARDATGLTAFLRQLRDDLPTHSTLRISISATTRRAGYRAMGYELHAIGSVVDRVMLMAYDQHGPWENTPGPIGALPWQRASLAAALHFVPRRKLDLGVAGYGYAWRSHSNSQLSTAHARRLAGSRARFNAGAGEWTATLADGSTLWWSDARSWRLRVAMAGRLHLHGLAEWVLGLADPLP